MTNASPPAPPPGPRPVRVVIVDDHEMMCDGLGALLGRTSDFQVIGSCGNIASALRLAAELRPDLMLVDIQLQDGDGLGLTRRIRQEWPDIRVLVMTAQTDQRLAPAAFSAGAAGFVLKTAAGDALLAALRAALAGGEPLEHRGAGGAKPVPGPAVPELPAREAQVLQLLLRGLRNKEIATELQLGIKTVETYRARLMRRFGCRSTAELVQRAISAGLVSS